MGLSIFSCAHDLENEETTISAPSATPADVQQLVAAVDAAVFFADAPKAEHHRAALEARERRGRARFQTAARALGLLTLTQYIQLNPIVRSCK